MSDTAALSSSFLLDQSAATLAVPCLLSCHRQLGLSLISSSHPYQSSHPSIRPSRICLTQGLKNPPHLLITLFSPLSIHHSTSVLSIYTSLRPDLNTNIIWRALPSSHPFRQHSDRPRMIPFYLFEHVFSHPPRHTCLSFPPLSIIIQPNVVLISRHPRDR